MSPSSRLVPLVIRVTRRGRVWRTADSLHEAVAARPPLSPVPARIGRLVPEVLDGFELPAVRIAASGASADPVLYLHGGGYVFDLMREHWRLVADLAATSGRPVVVVRYPLGPVGHPDAVVPAVAAIARRLQGGGRLTLAGDSAGGGLALAVATRLRDEGAEPPALILSSPWLDVTVSDPAVARVAPRDPWLSPAGLRAAGDLWRGDLPREHPLVSPLNADLAGLGPMTVFTGTRDAVNPDARALVPAVRAAGGRIRLVEGSGLMHNFALMPVPEGRAARRIMTAALTDPRGGG